MFRGGGECMDWDIILLKIVLVAFVVFIVALVIISIVNSVKHRQYMKSLLNRQILQHGLCHAYWRLCRTK